MRSRFKITKPRLLLISMSSLFTLALLSLLFLYSLSPSSSSPPNARRSSLPPSMDAISQACKATRFREMCVDSLRGLPPNPNPIQIIRAAISVSAGNLERAQSSVRSIHGSSAGSPNRTNAAANCIETLDYSMRRTQATEQMLVDGAWTGAKVKDARAWMGDALQTQYACWSGLSYANDTKPVAETMKLLNDTVLRQTSNALSMIASLDRFGGDTALWAPPKTERDGVWEKPALGTKSLAAGGVPAGLTANLTVCKHASELARASSGKGRCYETVQDAVNAAPSDGRSRIVIRIEAGRYEESVRIPFEKKNLVFLGDGMGKTVISGSSFVKPGVSTYNTATLAVLGDGFMMSQVTVENTAGAGSHQAVAFRSGSDKSVIDSCEFLGNQDTLYADTGRQYYARSVIVGNVDFIFGNAAAVFHKCSVLVRPRLVNLTRGAKKDKGETNAVTAQGRVDPAQATGFVFNDCLVNGTEEYMESYRRNPAVHKDYLGRPWKQFSRTVFIQSRLEALIRPAGWLQWNGGSFALDTLYYAEFGNTGPGAADPSARVSWSSRIPPEHVGAYSLQSFIQGDQWIPSSSSRKPA